MATATGKSLAQVRGDILADIEAVRLGRMDVGRATAIFQGYKEMTSTINTEIAIFKAALRAKEVGFEFAEVARLGQRVVNEEEGNKE